MRRKLALYSAARQYPTMVALMKANNKPSEMKTAKPTSVTRRCCRANERRIKSEAGKYKMPKKICMQHGHQLARLTVDAKCVGTYQSPINGESPLD